MSMKRVLETRTFQRWLRKTLLTDAVRFKAVEEMERRIVDADLGGDAYTKRMAHLG